jgi:hypothetical protein
MNYQTGDAIFFKCDGSLLSKIINWVSDGIYSHCGILIVDELDGIHVLESEFGKNRCITPLSDFHREYDILQTHELFNRENIYKNHFQIYGYIDILTLGFSLLMKKLFNIDIKTKDFIGEICSELVCKCLGLHYELLSPTDLFNRLSKLNLL